jgi:hypothetical protein
MKRLVLLALAVSLAVSSAAEAAPAKKRRSCSAPGPTIAHTLEARVYSTSTDYNHSMIGCHHRTNRRWEIGAWYSCGCSISDGSQPQVWLTGRFAAVNAYSCSPISLFPDCTGGLRVYDLKAGRRARHEIDTGGPIAPPLLKRNGSIALLVEGRLVRVDSTGTAVVDEGPGIDEDSLAASRNRLYWMREGAPHTAAFN